MKLSDGRLGYLTATLGLLAVGGAVVLTSGSDRRVPLLTGAIAAWLIQAPAYWVLSNRLERGLDATRAWVAGMGARVGGFAVLAVTSWVSDLPSGPAAAAYGIAMVAFLLLEALWLAGRRTKSNNDGQVVGLK